MQPMCSAAFILQGGLCGSSQQGVRCHRLWPACTFNICLTAATALPACCRLQPHQLDMRFAMMPVDATANLQLTMGACVGGPSGYLLPPPNTFRPLALEAYNPMVWDPKGCADTLGTAGAHHSMISLHGVASQARGHAL
eukprot:221475-Chlamydomonas_euryale.AAC.18